MAKKTETSDNILSILNPSFSMFHENKMIVGVTHIYFLISLSWFLFLYNSKIIIFLFIYLIFKLIFVYLRDCSNIIILDESLKFLSKEYLQNASDFLRDICERLEMQIILVSHKEDLKTSADNVISIDKIDNKSVIL